MKIHLVGGFLGSGKTTAIINAARILMTQGKKVGVVTNDQGKYLVDTSFFRMGDVPVVEVTGGCFCCNYDDLEDRLDQIAADIQPDVIFAESVGSCGDLVATVLKPLIQLRGSDFPPASFSVFTDCRMLQLHLSGEGLPFSDNVTYIFEKQIEEAGLLIINKIDLMQPPDVEALLRLAKSHYPHLAIRPQSSIDADDIHKWLGWIENEAISLPQKTLEIDYRRYGDGEAQLAWLDDEITLVVPEDKGQEVITRLIDAIRIGIRDRQAAIGHLKFIVQGGGVQEKVSITTLPGGEADLNIPFIPGRQVTILINARVEMPADQLHDLVDYVLNQVSTEMASDFSENSVSFFHPGFPNPTHRIG